jgi:type I restriction-modification system DNA methylase subunit
MVTEKSPEKSYIEKLIKEYQYPKEDILTNFSSSFGMARYVLDIVVVKEGKPYIIVEIKRNISQVSIDQLRGYVRATGAKFAVASNGYIDHCYAVQTGYETTLQEIPDIPRYGEELKTIGTHENNQLVSVDSYRFEKLLWEIADTYRTQGLSPEESIRDLSKILLLKVYDENTGASRFRALFGEPSENVQSRINALRIEAAKQYPDILKDQLVLKNENLAKVVQLLQKYSVLGSANDSVGSKLPVANFYGPRSAPIPKKIAKFMVELLQLKPAFHFISPESGVGDLIVEAAKRGADVTGTESKSVLAQFAKISLALSNLNGTVVTQPRLTPAIENDSSPVKPTTFDYAAVYPPFGVRVGDSTLNNFILGSSKKSQSLDVLLLEYTLGLLKKGGKMVIVVPEGFLFADSTYDVREFLLRKTTILAIIGLPQGSFAHTAIKTSIILLENSTNDSVSSGNPLETFVAAPENLDSLDEVLSDYYSYGEKKFSLSRCFIWSATNLTANYLINETRRFLDDVSQERPSKAGGTLRLKKKNVESMMLRELVGFTSGARLEDVGERDSNGAIYYLKAGNVGDYTINLDSAERLCEKKDFSRWRPATGDILMTRAGTVGRVALVREESKQMIVGINVVKLSIYDKSRLLPEYLLAYLSSKQGVAQINLYTGGAAIRAISLAGIGQIKVPIVPIEKQQKIAEQVKEVIETKEKEKRIQQELQARETQILDKIENMFGE